jgi:hypothetical protein
MDIGFPGGRLLITRLLLRGTTLRCGKWYVVTNEALQETCTAVYVKNKIPWTLFMEVNPSLSTNNCDKLVNGAAYCAGPTYGWGESFEGGDF